MSARTCLLCGKALSRIWVGAGEDFCSREHRNQYRLRRGMDRLQEASKVASLMRRRENPKAIPFLYCEGNVEARTADQSQIRFSANQTSLQLPVSKWSASVQTPGSRSYISHYQMPISEGTPREFGIPRPKKARVILHERAREVEAAGTNYQERIKRPLEVQGSAKSGHALRVSSGAGFRVPAMQSLDFHPAAHRPAIIWPSRLHGGMVSRLDRPATQNVPAVRFHLPHVELPSTHVSVRATGISARGPIVYRRKLLESVDPEVRAAHEIWTNWEQAAPRPIPHAGRNGAAPQFVRLKQDRMGSEASPHLVLVPIMPEDRAFSYIPQIVVSPAGLSGVPKVSLEEQFDSGLRNWTGGVDDWLLDAAGARTGSLALFNPTLDKRDYEMEFLARIDHRSVTCAFRATSLTEYHLAKIAVADGAFTFQHGVNLGGNREWSEPAPIGVALNRKNAITVKLRAVGSEFSVSVDGQVIETWSDNRLPAGGVGFEGVPDDRARIYWVRLSPLGSPGKEYSRR